jgi:hypothetical protein
MKHFLSGLWMLTTISGVGCAVGSSADLGADVGPAPESDDGTSGAAPASQGLPGDGGSSETNDGAASAPSTSTKDSGGAVPEGSVDSGATVACTFTGALVSFDLTKLTGTPANVAASVKAPGVSASALRRVGVTATSSAGAMNASGWPTGALDTGKHYAFSISPPPGCTLTLTTLAVDLKASTTGPTLAAIGTSVDGYAHLENLSVAAAGGATNVSLAGITGVGGPVEIHVFGFAADATTGTLRIQDTLSLTGALGN